MDIVIMTLLYVEAFRQLGKKEQKIYKKKKIKHLLEKAEQQTSWMFLVQPNIVNKIKSHPLVNQGNHILN